MELASLGEDPPLEFDQQLRDWLDQLQGPQENSFPLLRNTQEYLCIAGQLRQGGFGVRVAQLRNTRFHSVAGCSFDNPILSCDIGISPHGPLVVLGIQNQGIYAWRFLDRDGKPFRLPLDETYGNARGLYLNASGQLLATILPREVRVFSLANLEDLPWRLFPLDSEQVVLSASAEDRSCVVLGTDKKRIWLLLFEDPQELISP